MDFLNKYFAQLRELFEGMTPGARITSALLLVVTVASLGYLFTAGFNAGGDVFLLDNRTFSSDELTPMLAAFATEGLSSPEIVGGRIRVPRGKEMTYVAALAKAGTLPHDFSSILDRAIDKSGPFEDKAKFQARLLHGKQQMLADIFREMDGIQRASVIIDEETRPGLTRERVVTAAISIMTEGNRLLEDGQVGAIRQTMLGAVAGLKPENVTIMDLNAGKSHRGLPSDSGGADGTPMAQEQRRMEDYWRGKVQSLLGLVPGAIVTPTVQLTPERIHRTQSTMYDKDNSISVNTTESKTSRDFTGENNGGRPGYAAQQNNTPRALTATETKGAEEKEKTSELVESKLPAGEVTEKEFAAHTVERVSVAIAVPTSWFTQIWQKRNPAPSGESPKEPPPADIDKIRTTEIARIKSLVAGALPIPQGVAGATPFDKTQLVEVTDIEDIVLPPLPEPTLTENAGSWLAANWSTVALILLGLASLTMLRSMIRSVPPGGSGEIGHFEPVVRESGESQSPELDEEPVKIAFSGSGGSLRDELTQLVATDPETAANILKSWIGSGAK
ncbi:MAG: flagellar M-ring protein FliF C-terminal domain-containing protein [Thermoguttaceae bacterium]